MDQKICCVCKDSINLDDFGKSSKNKDGRDNRCKICRNRLYRSNRDSILIAAKVKYAENRERILKQKADSYLLVRDARTASRRKAWRDNSVIRANNYAYKDNLHKQCFAILGNICKACGISDPDVLCIDHIHNDGQAERASGISNVKIWREVINGSDRYQLLCFNCNFRKGYESLPVTVELGQLKHCNFCNNDLDISNFKIHRRDSSGRVHKCRSCYRSAYFLVKCQVFSTLGGRCVTCSCDDPIVLALDHKNGDGYQRRDFDKSGHRLYKNIQKGAIDKSIFQVMCHNCNMKKAIVNGEINRFSRIASNQTNINH